jgi:hypothetical protein
MGGSERHHPDEAIPRQGLHYADDGRSTSNYSRGLALSHAKPVGSLKRGSKTRCLRGVEVLLVFRLSSSAHLKAAGLLNFTYTNSAFDKWMHASIWRA